MFRDTIATSIQATHFIWSFVGVCDMKISGAGIAGWLVCVLVSTIAVAQSNPTSQSPAKSDVATENSKQADQETTKPGQTTKNARKNSKGQPPKSTGKKSVDGIGNSDEPSIAAPGTPDEQKIAVGAANPKVKIAEPNWSVEWFRVESFASEKYTRDAVTLAPTEGQMLVQAKFEIQAMRPDAKAVDRYLRVWNSADRKELTRQAKTGARVLEAKNVMLRSPDGKRFPAIWNLDEGIRTRIIDVDIAPNRQSTKESYSAKTSPNSPWLDAEQSFMTRISRPFNQPVVTEYATVFTGILRTDEAFPVTFLFSIPTSVDLKSLQLVVDSDAFANEE